MGNVYETNFAISATTSERSIEIRNPSGSKVDVAILRIALSGLAGLSVCGLHRYTSLATHGTGGDAPTQQTLYRYRAEAPAPTAEVWSGADGTKLDWTGLTVDFANSFQIACNQPNDADAEQLVRHIDGPDRILLAPGRSASITTPDGQADYTVKLLIEEIPTLPAAHIASSTLPASSAYTTATYFDVPGAWTALTFLVTYTAHASSTGAKPQWRVSWSDGTNDFIAPIVGTTVDTSSPPVASRSRYQDVELYPTTVAATTTVRFAVDVARLPGLSKVRLDVAEVGDTTNRGTVVVTVTGG